MTKNQDNPPLLDNSPLLNKSFQKRFNEIFNLLLRELPESKEIKRSELSSNNYLEIFYQQCMKYYSNPVKNAKEFKIMHCILLIEMLQNDFIPLNEYKNQVESIIDSKASILRRRLLTDDDFLFYCIKTFYEKFEIDILHIINYALKNDCKSKLTINSLSEITNRKMFYEDINQSEINSLIYIELLDSFIGVFNSGEIFYTCNRKIDNTPIVSNLSTDLKENCFTKSYATRSNMGVGSRSFSSYYYLTFYDNYSNYSAFLFNETISQFITVAYVINIDFLYNYLLFCGDDITSQAHYLFIISHILFLMRLQLKNDTYLMIINDFFREYMPWAANNFKIIFESNLYPGSSGYTTTRIFGPKEFPELKLNLVNYLRESFEKQNNSILINGDILRDFIIYLLWRYKSNFTVSNLERVFLIMDSLIMNSLKLDDYEDDYFIRFSNLVKSIYSYNGNMPLDWHIELCSAQEI